MTETALVATPPKSVLINMADKYGMEPAAFEATVRATVCKTATREEFAAFLLVAKEYNLNPLTKEIFAFPAKGGGIVPVVSIDGWCRISNDHPAMDGMEFEDIRESGELIAITCRIYRKDRSRAGSVTEYMSECKGTSDVWKRWPARMLRHKAMIQAARYTFGFSGVYDEDEYERMQMARDVTPERSGVMGRLGGQQTEHGFNDAAIAVIEEHAPKPRRAKKVETPEEAQEALQAGEAVEVPDTYETPATDDGKSISEVLEGDDIPEHLRRLAGGIPHDAETGEVIEEEAENPPEDAPIVEEASDTSDSAMDASEGSQEEISGLPDSSAPEAPSEPDDPDLPPELAEYIETVEIADTWLAFKKAMATFYATETFKKLGDDGQNRIRAQTWHLVNEMGHNGGERVDPGQDISAFRLWLEYTSDAEAIEGTFAFLQRGEHFKAAATQQQSGLKLAVNRRLEKIGGV